MKYYFSNRNNRPTTYAEANAILKGTANGRHRLTFSDNKTITINGDSLAQLVGVARQYCEPAEAYIDPEGPSVWFYEEPQ